MILPPNCGNKIKSLKWGTRDTERERERENDGNTRFTFSHLSLFFLFFFFFSFWGSNELLCPQLFGPLTRPAVVGPPNRIRGSFGDIFRGKTEKKKATYVYVD